jgi:hypothetical protein
MVKFVIFHVTSGLIYKILNHDADELAGLENWRISRIGGPPSPT